LIPPKVKIVNENKLTFYLLEISSASTPTADTVQGIFSFWLSLFRSANLFKVEVKINKLANRACKKK